MLRFSARSQKQVMLLLGFNTLDVKVQPVPFIFSFLPGIGFNTLDVKVQRVTDGDGAHGLIMFQYIRC